MRFRTRNNSSTVCHQCGRDFDTHKKLNVHVTRKHDENLNQCDYCDKTFRGRFALKNHQRVHYEKECSNCKKIVLRPSFPEHFKVCSKENEFICTICDYKMFNKRNFIRHKKKHVKVGNRKVDMFFPCKFCSKTYRSRKALQHHVKTKIRPSKRHLDSRTLKDMSLNQNKKLCLTSVDHAITSLSG